MAGTSWKAGPVAVATTSDDVAGVNPAAGTYRKIFHIHVANTNGASRALSMWIGATGAEGAGTALCEGKVIAANDVFDMYFPAGLRIVAADFLVALSSVDSTSLEITVTGESFVL
jgi:hypothetical protein